MWNWVSSALCGVSLHEIQFRIRVEKTFIAWLEKDTEELIRISEKIKEDLASLATTIKEVKDVEEKLTWMKSIGFWENLDQERLEDLQETFAPLMKFRKSESNTIIQLNLPDQIKERKWIIYGPSGEGAFAESYKGKVEAKIKQLTEVSIPLKKLKQGEILTEEDRAELEKALNTPDLYITEDILQKVYETPDNLIRKGAENLLLIEVEEYFYGTIGIDQDKTEIGPSRAVEKSFINTEYVKLVLLMIPHEKYLRKKS